MTKVNTSLPVYCFLHAIGLKPACRRVLIAGWLLFIATGAFAQLVPAFNPDKTQGCSPLQVSFNNSSSGAVSYLWNFGNGNTSTLPNPVTTFITPGTYTVTLTAKNITGIELTTTQNITVFSNPVAGFTANKTGGCVNDTISFTDGSVNGSNAITKWSWDFGDGSGSLSKTPAGHAYAFADQFRVTLVVEDQFGCRGTTVKNNYIDIANLKVDYSNTASSVCSGPLTVKFTDLTTPVNPLYTYYWDFGNGGTSTRQNDSNNYTIKGSYPVSLRVTHPNGCSVTNTKNRQVVIHEPKAAFSVVNGTGCQPLKVGLVNQSTSADPGVATYYWTTSAGHTSYLKNPEFVFTDTGTFDVTLKIVIPGVCADSVIHAGSVRVVPAANVAITASADKFCAPAQVSFATVPAQANVLGWIWGDNTTGGPGANPVKTFNQFGQFQVKAIVENTAGCRDTVRLANPITVRPSGFMMNLSKKNGCAPFSVFAEAVDTGLVPMTDWQWKVNGVAAGNSRTLSQTFADTGIYIITCTGSNMQGCTFSITDTIKAGALTYPQYTIDKETGCASDATFIFHNQTNQTTPRADSWFWFFGDNFAGLEEEPSHQYKDTGTFRIMLTAIHKGCSTSVEHRQVTVYGPKTSFTEPSLNCQNDSLLFTGNTKGGNTLLWNFGDGHSSADLRTKHKYAASGTYQVTLIARDTITGCSDTTIKSIHIPDMQVPVISFTQSTAAMCPGGTLVLEDHSVGGDMQDWIWVLSNNQNTHGKTVSFKIQDTGYHHLQLMIKDSKGCLFHARKDSAIRVYPGAVKFDVSRSIGCMPLPVTATDHSVTTFPVTKRSWKWGTGDQDESGASGSSSYTYATTPADQSAGYTIQLEITDSMGCSYTGTQVVRPLKPVAGYTSTLVKGCGYDSVTFRHAPTAGGFAPFHFYWLAGTDTLSTNEHPSLQFTLPDTSFTVQLVVSDSFRCSSSFSSVIRTDSRRPVAAFGAAPERILDCPGPPIFLLDSTTRGAAGIRSWEWSFGDQTKSILQSPSKTYLEPGSYDVTLKITDSLNCESSVTKSGYVKIAGPVATYRVISTEGCMPLRTSFEAVSSNTKKFEWDMGDGLIDTDPVYHHVYSRSGKFVPNLSITDSAGCRRVLPTIDTIVVHELPRPLFSSNKKRICAGSDVQFENMTTHDKPIVQYNWKFGDGDSLIEADHATASHTYINTGMFDVVLEATDSFGCSDTAILSHAVIVTDDKTAPAVPDVLRTTVLDNENVLLQFRQNHESDFAKYTVYYNYNLSGIPASADSSFAIDDTSFLHGGVNTLSNRYFYSVSATDVCRNESERAPLHGTVELTASPAGNAVTLQWSAYKGWNVAAYEIYRSDDGKNEFSRIAKVNGGITLFTDSTVLCHRTYYYKIRAMEENGNAQESWSDSSGAAPSFISTVPGTKNVRATVTDRGVVLLEWRKQVHTISFVPVLYRAVDKEEPVFYKELNTQDTFFVDQDANVYQHSYTYITYLKDNCGGLSRPSNPAKTILLSAELEPTGTNDYNPELTWTSYIGWESGVDKYEIEFKYDSLSRFVPKAITEQLSFFDRDVHEKQRKYCYRITAHQKGEPGIYSQSNMVCVSTDPVVYAPSAFSPNGDGVNEIFKIEGVFLEQFNMKIWNRYGELIYESNNMLDGWDGTFRGDPVPADAYTYLAEGRGRTGQLVEIKGSVTVLR